MRKHEHNDSGPREGSIKRRIDSPHQVHAEGAPHPHEVPQETPALTMAISDGVISPESAVMYVQQVRGQAEQLATHLRKRQVSLDHRESELNARFAILDSQTRSARLWLSENEQRLAEQRFALDQRSAAIEARDKTHNDQQNGVSDDDKNRLAELDRRQAELDVVEVDRQNQWQSVAANIQRRENQLQQSETEVASRAAELVAAEETWKRICTEAENALARKQASQVEESAKLARRGVELDQLHQELDRREKSIADRLARADQYDEFSGHIDLILARQKHLDAAEAMLQRQQAELDSQRSELESDRRNHKEQNDADRRDIVEEQRRVLAELGKTRETLARRNDDLSARRKVIVQLRDEVKNAQREALEMRLITEELWSRLCGKMAPAALTQSLAEIRSKIRDQTCQEQVEIRRERTDLETLRQRLTEQHEKLDQQRHQIQQWAERREAEIQQQAARLVGREQVLDAQDRVYARKNAEWQKERRGYEHEIRKLLRQLRKADAVAA